MKKKEHSDSSKSNTPVKSASDQAIHSSLGKGRRSFLLMVVILVLVGGLAYGSKWLYDNNKLGPLSPAKRQPVPANPKPNSKPPDGKVKIYETPPPGSKGGPPKPARTG